MTPKTANIHRRKVGRGLWGHPWNVFRFTPSVRRRGTMNHVGDCISASRIQVSYLCYSSLVYSVAYVEYKCTFDMATFHSTCTFYLPVVIRTVLEPIRDSRRQTPSSEFCRAPSSSDTSVSGFAIRFIYLLFGSISCGYIVA